MRMSVIIATYQRPDCLQAAIRSLLVQTKAPQEVIIAAWAGDSVTLARLKAMNCDRGEGDFPQIKQVITDTNTVIAKENAAIAQAQGEVCCFMDDDAVARPDWLERLAGHYADPSVGGVGGRDIIRINGVLMEERAAAVGRVGWQGRLTANHHNKSVGVREVDFLKGCNMSFRRKLLSPIGPRLSGSIPYGFEIDLGLAIREHGFRIVFDPEACVDHYPSSNMAAHNVEVARITNHNQTYVLLKHLPWPRKLAFLIYTFLIGDKTTIGLGRVPWLVARRRWPLAVVWAHLGGKLAGVRSYVSYLAWRPSRRRD